MNHAIQLEDRVSRSRSKHEGESSAEICDRLSRTRGSSQRQLPTDHDCAVSTREYQLDQSSLIPASAAADPVLDRKRQPAHLDRSLHINFRIAGDSTGTPEFASEALDSRLGDLRESRNTPGDMGVYRDQSYSQQMIWNAPRSNSVDSLARNALF
jgi:hypothetical protein